MSLLAFAKLIFLCKNILCLQLFWLQIVGPTNFLLLFLRIFVKKNIIYGWNFCSSKGKHKDKI